MDLSRRDIVRLSLAGMATSVAGCGEDAEVEPQTDGNSDQSQDDDESEQDQQQRNQTTADSDSGQDSGNGTDGRGNVERFQLGETAVFSDGDSELSFTPEQAILHEALIYGSRGNIYSESPSNTEHYFLTIKVRVENTGSESTRAPGLPAFILNGTQYELTYTSAYSENGYGELDEIRPGASKTGWVTYPVPPTDAEGLFVAEYTRLGDSVPAEWVIDLGEIERVTYEYTGLAPGENATLSADNLGYSIRAVSSREDTSYEYSSGDMQLTSQADTGMKFVFVRIRAENTGESSVRVPVRFDISLLTDSSQFEPGLYLNESEAYEGGEIASGVTREGIILFSVPESTSSYQLQVSLTDDITATWNL